MFDDYRDLQEAHDILLAQLLRCENCGMDKERKDMTNCSICDKSICSDCSWWVSEEVLCERCFWEETL